MRPYPMQDLAWECGVQMLLLGFVRWFYSVSRSADSRNPWRHRIRGIRHIRIEPPEPRFLLVIQ